MKRWFAIILLTMLSLFLFSCASSYQLKKIEERKIAREEDERAAPKIADEWGKKIDKENNLDTLLSERKKLERECQMAISGNSGLKVRFTYYTLFKKIDARLDELAGGDPKAKEKLSAQRLKDTKMDVRRVRETARQRVDQAEIFFKKGDLFQGKQNLNIAITIHKQVIEFACDEKDKEKEKILIGYLEKAAGKFTVLDVLGIDEGQGHPKYTYKLEPKYPPGGLYPYRLEAERDYSKYGTEVFERREMEDKKKDKLNAVNEAITILQEYKKESQKE